MTVFFTSCEKDKSIIEDSFNPQEELSDDAQKSSADNAKQVYFINYKEVSEKEFNSFNTIITDKLVVMMRKENEESGVFTDSHYAFSNGKLDLYSHKFQ